MTMAQRNEAELGRGYWAEYVKINGYAFRPNHDGLAKLARNLDLNIPHLQRHITRYLEA